MNIRKIKTNSLLHACIVFLAFSLGMFYFWPPAIYATANDVLPKDHTQKYILDNGMTVLLNEMPGSSMVAVYILVKTGSATEGEFLGSGISHYAEHMLFKGTHSREVGAIGREVKALGGVINASTSFDYTVYLLEIPAEYASRGIDILTDMVMNATFDPEEVESEREVIISEMRLHNDNPASQLSQNVFNTVYLRHPYRHPIIGYRDLFQRITKDDLVKYYKTHYVPNNMVVAVAGNFSAPAVLEEIKEKVKDFPRQAYVMRNLPQEPEQVSFRHFEKEFPTDMTRFSMAYPSVSVLNKDLYAMDVLAMLLGQGRSSRLYQEIYQKQQLVHSVTSSNYTPMDKGVFEVECTLERENVEKAVAAVKEQIKLIQNNGVTSKELEKVKRQALSDFVFGHQTASQVAAQIVTDESFVGDYSFSQKYVEGIGSVTSEDIKRVARKYLTGQSLNLVVLYPESNAAEAAPAGNARADVPVEKVVLDGGTVMLLREDHSVPVVSVSSAFYAGLGQEPDALTGLSELTARLWSRETKHLSSQDLARQIESLGAGLGAYSGRNTFGINANMLAGDFDTVYSLFEDVLLNPAFSEEEFQKEKEKMKADIRDRDDSIVSRTSQEMRRLLFQTHPLRRDPLGTAETVGRIKREDVVQFYKDYLCANDMVIAVFGDFKRDDALAKIRKTVRQLPQRKVTIATYHAEPLQTPQEKTITMDKEQAVVMFGFQGPTIKDKDLNAVKVLNSILGSSLSGRMFVKIRDDLGQAYTLGAGALPGLDAGLIYLYVNTTEENAGKVADSVKDIIKDVQANDVTDEEIQSSKDYLKGTFERGIETHSALAPMATLNELYGLGYNYHKRFPEEIDAVTKDDVRRVANAYFDLNRVVVVTTLPEKKPAKQE